MEILSSILGHIEIEDDKVVEIPDGLLGFGSRKRYVILQKDDLSPFKWLQSLDDPSLAFIITDPLEFFPDYRPNLSREHLETLGTDDTEDLLVAVIVTLSRERHRITANLQGPLVFNARKKLGKQIVLDDGAYPTRCPLFQKRAASLGG